MVLAWADRRLRSLGRRATGRRCSQNAAKNACVQLAQNENKAQRSYQANGSASTRTGCVASAQNIMQMLESRGNATCASCGMPRLIFQKSIANGNVVFFRVCLTCEMKKLCFKCGVAKPEAEFGPAAWKARNADRRCCRECTTKQRGCWQCSQCSERKPRAEFTAWQQSRKHTQDGTQVCNVCTAFAFVCRLAHRTNQRLARLRQRESRQRREVILADVCKEMQKIHEARQMSMGTDESRTKAERVLPIYRPSSLPRSPTQRRRGCTHTSARIAPNLCKALWQQGKSITAAVMAAAKNFAL